MRANESVVVERRARASTGDSGRTTSQYVLLLSVVRDRKSLRRGARKSLVDCIIEGEGKRERGA